MAPGWWQQRLGGYASTATPWQLRHDSIALMVVAWRLGVVVHAPDHDDDQGVAQTNDEQHRDHRHGERRLRPLWGLEDIMHLPVPLPVSTPMRPLPVLPVSSPQTAADHSPTCVAIRQ